MIIINGNTEPVAGMNLQTYLETHGYPLQKIAVERNGDIVPKAQYVSVLLEEGDTVEIVRFVGGG